MKQFDFKSSVFYDADKHARRHMQDVNKVYYSFANIQWISKNVVNIMIIKSIGEFFTVHLPNYFGNEQFME